MSDSSSQSPLGKPVSYASQYDPTLLFPIPRLEKRLELGLNGSLPFYGADLWNAYELSWLNPKGKPQVAIARFMVPADTPNIVESKSLKLYLNSFNQQPFASAAEVQQQISTDLSRASGGHVSVQLRLPDSFQQEKMADLGGYCIDNLDIEVTDYQPAPQLLHCDHSDSPVQETLMSNLLKSNCLVTGQPDWASVQIDYQGQPINRESLLRYIISFREHNEFHEQCVERLFVDIWQHCQLSKLSVYARYTRRGGLDINPFRTNSSQPWPAPVRTARQ